MVNICNMVVCANIVMISCLGSSAGILAAQGKMKGLYSLFGVDVNPAQVYRPIVDHENL